MGMWLKWNLCIAAMLAVFCTFAQQREAQLDYVERYLDLAAQEMARAGVPVSIKLGQAILESRWGTTDLAVIANNHFGIKCGGVWNGPIFYKEDDEYDSKGRLIPSCFRQYSSPEASFIAHSEFLRDPTKVDRYGFLFSLNPKDYKAWAKGLRKAGYATDREYDNKLIRIIESLELYRYDRQIFPEVVALGTAAPVVSFRRPAESQILAPLAMRWIRKLHSVDVHFGKELDPTALVLPFAKLWTYNTTTDHPARVVARPKEQAASTKRLRKSHAGFMVWHSVRANERMEDISRLYQIKLEALYRRNRLPEYAEVAAGELIKLQGSRVEKPPVLRIPNTAPPLPAVGGVSNSKVDPFSGPPRVSAYPSTPVGIKPPPGTNQNKPAGGPQLIDVESGNAPISPPSNVQYHVVKSGETLWSISKQYQLSVEQLKKLNRLYDDVIVPGIALRIR